MPWAEPHNAPDLIQIGKRYGPWTVQADDGLHFHVRFWKVVHTDGTEASKTAKYLLMAEQGLTDPQGFARGRTDSKGLAVPRSSLPYQGRKS